MPCGGSAGAAVACVVSVAAVSVGVLSGAAWPQAVKTSASAAVIARFLHDVSSLYCVFSAAKVCGVMLAAESVTLYPPAFATA